MTGQILPGFSAFRFSVGYVLVELNARLFEHGDVSNAHRGVP